MPTSSDSFSVDHFAQAMQDCSDGYIKIEGDALVSISTASPFTKLGTANNNACQARSDQTDIHTAFMHALRQRFGAAITESVIKELDLRPQPGRALPCAIVARALNMARTSMQALAGVDFITRLSLSAQAGTSSFANACARAGVDPASLSEEQRLNIDNAMQRRFEQAALLGLCPTNIETAMGWLVELIQPNDPARMILPE